MATGIPYCDEVLNVCVGCTKIKQGCMFCWSERLHTQRHVAYAKGKQLPAQYAKPFSTVQLLPDRLKQPLRWRKPRTIFVNSMSDTWHKDVPFEFIDKMFSTIEATQRHTYLLFTKRWGRALEYFQNLDVLPNIHLYFSASTQAEVDEAVPILLKIPVQVRGLSLEPLLKSVDIIPYCGGRAYKCKCEKAWHHTESNRLLSRGKREYCVECGTHAEIFPTLDSIITGCESGPNRRPCKIEWIESIVNQCQQAGVHCYVKQIDTTDLCPPGVLNNKVSTKPEEWPKCLRVRRMPK